jgi:hypothetical protein
MSVVSDQLGMFKIRTTKHVPIAVQYVKNDSGEAEPPDFTQGEQLPCFNLSKRIRLPALNMMPMHTGEFVPLKCHQQNSHAFGAALFNADTPAFTAQLDIESDVPYPTGSYSNVGISKFPDITPAIPYNQGIQGTRAIDFSNISEPTGAMFRKGVAKRRYVPPHISYDTGIDELRQMTMR